MDVDRIKPENQLLADIKTTIKNHRNIYGYRTGYRLWT